MTDNETDILTDIHGHRRTFGVRVGTDRQDICLLKQCPCPSKHTQSEKGI